MSSEMETVEIEDQKQHPNCHYSRAFQTHCRHDNNVNACEDIQRVLRLCPGERPIEIYKKSNITSDDEKQSRLGDSSVIDKFFRPFGFGFGHDLGKSRASDIFGFDPFALLNRELRSDSANGGDWHDSHPNHGRFMPGPSTESISPPHRVPKGQYPMKAPSVNGYATGPSESI
jgi:hypothetical protein